jgi:hypothetical protein
MSEGLAPHWVAALLALATLAGAARLAWHAWRTTPAARPRAWRLSALVALQALAAVLLYFTLLPPERSVPGGTLVVLTPGVAGEVPPGEHVVALPGVEATAGAQRVPDLGTALRRHPGAQRLHVAGAGLPERDLPAAAGLAIAFEPPPLPAGIVELHAPTQVAAASTFAVHGRVHGVAGGAAELLDPAGRRVDQVALADDGNFVLHGATAAPGEAEFQLRVRDAARAQVEVAPVPLQVDAPAARAMLLMSGAPNPEARFLQRWALDAGMSVHAQASLGAGVRIGDPPIAFDADSLGRFDVAVFDERAWQDIGSPAHAALRDAVADGLGLVVRITGPLTATGRARLRDLGLALESVSLPSTVRLAASDAPEGDEGDGMAEDADASQQANAGTVTGLPALDRQPLRAVAGDGTAILRDAGGEPLAFARNHGRGRVAAWLVTDTWRLVLAGHRARHARLWSDALGAVARPGAPPGPRVAGDARAGSRVVLCGLPAGSRVRAPDGTMVPLHLDPSLAEACAGYWPRMRGWHRVEAGEVSTPFHVDAADALPVARLLALRERTLALAAAQPSAAVPGGATTPGPRWPWFLGLLAVLALLWWLERARAGRHAEHSPPGGPASV